MVDPFNRWSQLVRTPGAVEITSHHPVEVPPIGSEPPYSLTRPGVRLLVNALDGTPPIYTIDMTSSATIAMLEGFLATGAHVGKRIAWRARGFGPRRRDTIHIKPLG